MNMMANLFFGRNLKDEGTLAIGGKKDTRMQCVTALQYSWLSHEQYEYLSWLLYLVEIGKEQFARRRSLPVVVLKKRLK